MTETPSVRIIARATAAGLAIAASLMLVAEVLAAGKSFRGRNGVIAFDRGGNLFIVSASPGAPPRLIRRSRGVDDHASSPTWSPDGRSLLFARGARSNDITFETVSPRGGRPRRLLHAPYGGTRMSWAPDGRRIVYSTFFDTASLFIADVARGSNRQLTFSPDPPRGYYDTSPAWSPDGRTVVFVREPCCEPGRNTLFTVPAAGGRPRRLTAGNLPDWSPGGDRIVFVRKGDVFTIRHDGSDLRRLTRTRQAESSPVWSPRGRELAFVRANALWVRNLTRSREIRIARIAGPRSLAAQTRISWQPLR